MPPRLPVPLVALLYGFSGALSYLVWSPQGKYWRLMLVPLPFGLLSAALLPSPKQRLLAVPLSGAAWTIAYCLGCIAELYLPAIDGLPKHLLAAAWSGLTGGLIVATGAVTGGAAAAIKLGAIGGLAALPFVLWLHLLYDQVAPPVVITPGLVLLCSFIIWQALTGAALFVSSRHRA